MESKEWLKSAVEEAAKESTKTLYNLSDTNAILLIQHLKIFHPLFDIGDLILIINKYCRNIPPAEIKFPDNDVDYLSSFDYITNNNFSPVANHKFFSYELWEFGYTRLTQNDLGRIGRCFHVASHEGTEEFQVMWIHPSGYLFGVVLLGDFLIDEKTETMLIGQQSNNYISYYDKFLTKKKRPSLRNKDEKDSKNFIPDDNKLDNSRPVYLMTYKNWGCHSLSNCAYPYPLGGCELFLYGYVGNDVEEKIEKKSTK